jgi:diacylglycerol kinase family enzyme
VFRAAGRDVTLFPTTRPNEAGELARHAAESGFDLVLAAGGDGTINEAVNGMVGSPVAFGALPAGTANVLANELGLSNRPDRAASQLLDAIPTRISVGALDRPGVPRRHFLLMAGVGLDALIIYDLDLDLKRRRGKWAYWEGGLRNMARATARFPVEVGGRKHHASFALITRVRNYGGDFEIARRIRLTDADFEVVLFERGQWYDYVKYFGSVVVDRLYHTPGVTVVRASEVQLRESSGDKIHVQTDGELLGTLPATVSTVPDSLALLLPPSYLAKL